MDPGLIQDFESKLFKLKSATSADDVDQKLAQDMFQDVILTYTSGTDVVNAERYTRLLDIMGADAPLLLACKHNGFWDTIDKPDNTEQSFDFVSTRKKRQGSKSSTHSSSHDQGSICGSPLKLEVIADLSLFEEGDSPVPIVAGKKKLLNFGLSQEKARKLVSLYSILVTSVAGDLASVRRDLPTILALCDGQNLRSVSLYGLKPLVDQQNNLLGIKLIETLSKPSVDKSSHMKIIPNFVSSDITCKAKYDILAEAGDKFQPDLQNSIKLEFEWQEVAGKSLVLLHEPPMKAGAMVKIQKASGCTDSPMFCVYQELEILRSVIEGLTTTEVNWIGVQECPLMDSVKDLVEQLKLGSDIVDCRLGETTTNSVDDIDHVSIDLLQMEERKDLDFTDHLWKILQSCTSYSELIETFKFVVTELRKGDFQPFIHMYNATTLGQMVKDSYRGQLRAPLMTGLSPLQYLAEIGVQKLTQDYIHMFLSKSLANLGMLGYFLKGNLELDEKLERLTKLHNTMETVIMLKQSLHLPQEVLSKSCRQMLKHYESHMVDNDYHFAFSVSTASLRNVVEKFEPAEWQAEGIKPVEGVPEKLIYHFTTDQPFDWVKVQQPLPVKTGSSGDIEEENIYFLTVVKESVSILC